MWRSTLLYLCLCLFTVWAGSDERESKLVTIAQGVVRGYKDPEHGFYAFQSIPYATAPTGPNKFMAPLPPPVWLHTFDAIDKKIICPQLIPPNPIFHISNPRIQENCLIANVFIPDTEETNLPVLVYVHGGDFNKGWGKQVFQRKLIPEHNIIIVNFNYRLGIHGFLCLGTDAAPGNAGMKDQVELLRWVKKNIASFGGNPDDVTLVGSSAGSVFVDLLMLSKSTEGLFNKVIPESGVGTKVNAIQIEPLENGKLFAKLHNFTNVDDIYALEQFYKTAPFELLLNVSSIVRPDSAFMFAPCVERASKEAFLDKSPIEILKSGSYKKVPVLHGFCNMEGITRLNMFGSWKNKMNKKFSDFLPADLKFESEEEKREIGKTVKEFYFGDKPVDNENILTFIDYFTDVRLVYALLRSIRFMTEHGHNQIFLYEYSFVDESTSVVPHTNKKGATHCSQTLAVICESINQTATLTEDFKKISHKVRQLWANFIKTGKPVPAGSELPSWPAVQGDWAPHMSISKELQLRGSPSIKHRASFWDNIYSKHYRNPLPPPPPERQVKHEL